MIKKTFAVGFCLAMCLLFCGCSRFSLSISDMMAPPKMTGQYYEIQTLLEEHTGAEVIPVYPGEGDYRSAYIIDDFDRDGSEEAVVFYGTPTDDNSLVMHVALTCMKKGKWTVKGDVQVKASEIERVLVENVDDNKAQEVLIYWNTFNSSDKLLTVFGMKDGGLVQRMQETCTYFALCDLVGEGKNNIFTVCLNTVDKSSTASLFSLTNEKTEVIGTCMLDGNIQRYLEPKISKLANGKPAVYLDAVKTASSMITEIIYYDQNTLKAPSYDILSGENNITLRQSLTEATDFNNDGIYEIPHLERIPVSKQYSNSQEFFVTEWRVFDTSGFKTAATAIMNYTDGYYLTVPSDWVGRFTIVKRSDSNQRIFYNWDQENEISTNEFMRIQVVSLEEYEKNRIQYTGFVEIARDSSQNIYIAKVGEGTTDARVLSVSVEQLRDMFSVISSSEKGE
ncbi:MAG: hypothetical protein Q4B04_01190 [bacterium]|nr:hypothetical protein [bacterium]